MASIWQVVKRPGESAKSTGESQTAAAVEALRASSADLRTRIAGHVEALKKAQEANEAGLAPDLDDQLARAVVRRPPLASTSHIHTRTHISHLTPTSTSTSTSTSAFTPVTTFLIWQGLASAVSKFAGKAMKAADVGKAAKGKRTSMQVWSSLDGSGTTSVTAFCQRMYRTSVTTSATATSGCAFRIV